MQGEQRREPGTESQEKTQHKTQPCAWGRGSRKETGPEGTENVRRQVDAGVAESEEQARSAGPTSLPGRKVQPKAVPCTSSMRPVGARGRQEWGERAA